MSRCQAATDIRIEDFDWKRKVSDTLMELDFISDTFTGKIIISFNQGGVTYLEKSEMFK
jgi:hypothetical protein